MGGGEVGWPGMNRIATVVLSLVFIGCGGGSGEDDFQFQEDAAGDAAHWADVWCDVDGTMTRDDVIELMGDPTSEYDAESGFQPQSQWDAGPFDYTVFYDGTGLVDQAQVNELQIEDSGEPAPFDCELSRFF